MNGPGVRYEIGVAIQTGYIVWVHGPFPCGEWSDLRILREALIYNLDEDEFLLADGGYYDGNNFTVTPTGLNEFIDLMRSQVRARHETCNGRFKKWGVLKNCYRHDLAKHGVCFRAIANLTQVAIENGEPLFSVHYVDL